MNPFTKTIKSILLPGILLCALNLFAQIPPPAFVPDTSLKIIGSGSFCSNDMLLSQLRKDPAFLAMEEKMNRDILKVNRNNVPDTITLPVVIHIINNDPNSISDAQVIAGIDDLNDAFSKAGSYAASLGVDTKIRFCIAKTDPDGGITTGITRTKHFISANQNMDIEDRRLKNLIQWDPTKYINIWLIERIDAEAYALFRCGTWYRGGVGGYATMPPGGGAYDGVVITGFKVLLAHEMGHYLGLYHTFEGGCNNFDCTTTGDRVCDTPPDQIFWSSSPCNSPDNSCNTDTLSNHSNGNFTTDVPDQIANFMDYGTAACKNQFTQGQADRMRAAIISQRSGLLTDKCSPPCIENILSSFTRDLAYPLPGNTINFTNTSTGAANYQWLVDGVPVSTSSNFSYTFSSTGKYKVTLKAFNTASCFASYSDFITVTCGVMARFYTNKKTIASKTGIILDSITFFNASQNAQTFQWLMSNNVGMSEQLISTSSSGFTYTFQTPGTYRVRMIAANGSCIDTTETYVIPVLDPTPDGSPYFMQLTCFQQTKIRVFFCLSNSGYVPFPKGTPVNFYNADPRIPGATKLSPTFYLPTDLPGNCNFCYSHILDVNYRNTDRIFLSFSDSGIVMPVVLPNTPNIERNYNNNILSSISNRTTVNRSICQGQNYAGYSVSGTYIDTLYSVVNGCDSIRTLNLTVKPVFTSTVTTSICQGDNYAGHTTTGTFVDVYTASNGCDSTRTLHLTVKPIFKTSVTAAICEGENFYGHTTSGVYTDHYFAMNGCDSARTVQLTVKPVIKTNITASICEGQNYAGHIVSGTYVDSYFAANGCDSTRTLNLTVKPTFKTTITASICQGENYAGHTATGTFVDSYSAANGCDSIRTLNLTVNPIKFSTVFASICPGDNYAGHTTNGTFTDVYQTVFGCDSTRTLHLTVKPVFSTNIAATICEGSNYAGHTQSGIYTDVYPAMNGCDSTRTLRLTVNPKKFTAVNAAICFGETYLAGGKFQTASGIYFDTLRTYLGCDSVITTNLTVHPLPQPDLGPDRGVCIGDMMVLDPGNFSTYRWQNGNSNSILTTNSIGTYSVKVTDIFGCTNADTVHLTEIYPLPANFMPEDSSLCRGNILQVRIPGYKNYNWSTGSSNNFIDVSKTGKYNLQVTDKYNCKGIDSMNILFYNCINIMVPNAFTPNADGLNDDYKPLVPAPVSNYHMLIWNRWGQLLFETKNYKEGWDGAFKSKLQPIGAYVYLITLTDVDGNNIKKSGTLMLIR